MRLMTHIIWISLNTQHMFFIFVNSINKARYIENNKTAIGRWIENAGLHWHYTTNFSERILNSVFIKIFYPVN